MTVVDLVVFAIIGIAAGWLGGLIMRGRGFGMIGNLVVGIVGAFIGGLLFGWLGITTGGILGSIITATVGAVVLLFLAGLFRGGASGTAHPGHA